MRLESNLKRLDGADTRRLVSAIPKTFSSRPVERILSGAMPFYHRVYGLGERQFITTGTSRRTSLFLSDRFWRCFVQSLEEMWRGA